MIPLFGTKTHPLSAFAKETLRNLMSGPIPTNQINPGVGNRLMRETLVQIVELHSPYVSHKGKNIPHYEITEKGKQELK